MEVLRSMSLDRKRNLNVMLLLTQALLYMEKSTIPTEGQVAPEEQKQKLESGKMENEKPEPHLSFLLNQIHALNLHSRLLQKKMFILPGRSSMRLAGLEPELVANSLADTSPEIKLENLNLNISLHEEPSDMQLDRGQGIELSHYFSNDVDISTHAEPSNKSEKSVEDPLIPEKQPHTQAQMGDLEKPEPELAFSLGDCWSDPCLGFSFKTLTGVIPIEDNLVPPVTSGNNLRLPTRP
ncbi:hypothetical protein FNV43_RR09237 [Rhamnella rubrinervis]|uniref:Uncharacterized protein n=1 Tax=Rhamnella rubrinervis TaxID=2594499 RepID=A0A8K0HAB0_9ROSA|nr:hypothetical protein FNV43_RR09237 [Rhamnella rubrinervis]